MPERAARPVIDTGSGLPAGIDTVVWKTAESRVHLENNGDERDGRMQKEIPVPVKYSGPMPGRNKFIKADDHFDVLCLVPFKYSSLDTAVSKISPSSLRFVQYYAGMDMAIRELGKEAGKKVNFDVRDAESVEEVSAVLSAFDTHPPHLILGPQKPDALKFAADWAKAHETSLISPWVSSSTITENNPYYIQTKAGITGHYSAICEHARSHFPSSSIILVSKSAEESRTRYFNDKGRYRDTLEEKIIREADLSTGVDPVVGPLLKNTGPTVFIMPYASSKDENYVYHFLRRMISEKGNKEVVVYGTYKWIEMKSEISDFMNICSIRLSMGNFHDPESSAVKGFKRRYFDVYREFPSQDAMEGYDLARYAVSSLRQNGADFQWKEGADCSGLLETNFDLQPVIKNKGRDAGSSPDYYENAFLKIVEVKSNRCIIID